jgi:predicted SAM-dependent methyltransferase
LAPARIAPVARNRRGEDHVGNRSRSLARDALLRAKISERFAQDLRREVHLLGVRVRRRLDVRLHVGCGPRRLEGWLNVDGWPQPGVDLVCDLREPLPLRDASCALVYTDHVVDAIDVEFRPPLFREFHRVLKPGGVARIVVPHSGRFADAYVRNDREWFERVSGHDSRGRGLNWVFMSHFHRCLDDFETLSATLKDAGFREVVESSHRGSRIEALRVDTDTPDRILSNLYVEATK